MFDNHFGSRLFYVYTFYHPDGSVLYVGKGCWEKSTSRIASHLYAARGKAKHELYDAIRAIWAQGGVPIVSKVQTDMTEPEALALEMQLILCYGYDNLTNRRPRSFFAERARVKQLQETEKVSQIFEKPMAKEKAWQDA